MQRIGNHLDSELFIGLVGAVGTDLREISDLLAASLKELGYTYEVIQLSELLHEIDKFKGKLPSSPEDLRITKHMDAGDKFRVSMKTGEALALLAIQAIREYRLENTGDIHRPIQRHAYIIRSFKHPEEVLAFRRVYRDGFHLISAYSRRSQRLNNLAAGIKKSKVEFHESEDFYPVAENLMQRDQAEQGKTLGQNVRETFPLADIFVDTTDKDKLQQSLKRSVELLFGYPFHTPTQDEFAMFHARAAACRSSAHTRQVGTVITTVNGDIVAVGTNEVPKAGGGLYWTGDIEDHRDFKRGYEPIVRMNRTVIGEVLERLRKHKWLSDAFKRRRTSTLIKEATREVFKGAKILDLIEFGRTVHAEMAAIADAARRGVALQDCTQYVTTFPCHDCAKHIVAAGIKRVVYIEPYAKSLAGTLYPDSIAVDGHDEKEHCVVFEPFVGIAPQRYIRLFSMLRRMDTEGNTINWEGREKSPRLTESPESYMPKEGLEATRLKRKMVKCGFVRSKKSVKRGGQRC